MTKVNIFILQPASSFSAYLQVGETKYQIGPKFAEGDK